MANQLVIGTDNEVNINALMQENTDPPVYVDNAVITWLLQDPAGPTTLGTGTFNYVAASEGNYTTIIPAPLTSTLVANKTYNLIQSAVAQNFTAAWSDVYEAIVYPSAQFTYALRQDIEDVYGPSNVAKWADTENLANAQFIDRRIVWALKQSYDDMNSRLLGCPYTIPFQGAPPMIIRLQAQYAGVLLYNSRGVTDYSPEGKAINQLAWHLEEYEKACRRIHAGTLRLPAGDQVSTTVPRVFKSCSNWRQLWGGNWW